LYSNAAAEKYRESGVVTRSNEFHCVPVLIFSFDGEPDQSLWDALNKRATLDLPSDFEINFK
jgi:hypothetical protein